MGKCEKVLSHKECCCEDLQSGGDPKLHQPSQRGSAPGPGSPGSHRLTPLPCPTSPARGILAFLSYFMQENDLFSPPSSNKTRKLSLKAAFLVKQHSLSTAGQKLEPEKLHLKKEPLLLRESTCCMRWSAATALESRVHSYIPLAALMPHREQKRW